VNAVSFEMLLKLGTYLADDRFIEAKKMAGRSYYDGLKIYKSIR
jgi:hypothetical protein